MPSRVRQASSRRQRRGRPSKFGQPSRVVAVTLPQSAVRGLQRIDRDLGWAIVRLVEKGRPSLGKSRSKGAELVLVGARHALIVVDPSVVCSLPGVALIPFGEGQAFLALEPGHGLAELQLAVVDRLDDDELGTRQREGLAIFRRALRRWQNDARLTFRESTILIAEWHKRRRRRSVAGE